jgi:hypothetical protein
VPAKCVGGTYRSGPTPGSSAKAPSSPPRQRSTSGLSSSTSPLPVCRALAATRFPDGLSGRRQPVGIARSSSRSSSWEVAMRPVGGDG